MSGEIEAPTVEGVPTPQDVPRLDDMPMLGFGTWQLDDPEECLEAVSTALDVGYRHLDTAQAYGNESAVGEAIDRSEVARNDVFLATKIWIDNLDYDATKETAYESLDRLGTDSVDLLYVHWPAGEYDAEETLSALDELVDEGAIERIGVANFEPEQLAEACERTDAPIFANQFECHPLLQQERLLSVCAEYDVHPVAYSPLARSEVLDVPEIADVADKHEVSAAQVSLAWLRQRGIPAIPKAASEAHIHDNWESLSVRLDEADMEKIDGIEAVDRQVDPGFAPWN